MAKKENFTFKTGICLFTNYHFKSLAMEISEEENGRIKNSQVEIPWERETKISRVIFFNWEEFEDASKKLNVNDGKEPEITSVIIKDIDINKCQVEVSNDNQKKLRIPASACQSIEFTTGEKKFSYNITAEEAKEPHLLKLDELKEEADILYKNIIDTAETEEFSEETIGEWFKRIEEIKFESGSIVLKLEEAEKSAGNRKLAEIKKIFEKRPFRDKREYFLDKADNFYIKKIEELGRKDEQINNIDFIRDDYDDWRDYIREQNTINGIMKSVKNNLVPKVQTIPLVADQAETELTEGEAREEVKVETQAKEDSQILVSDKNETTNIYENQIPEPSTSTDITSTENHTDDNLPAENIPQAPEANLDEYEKLWELIKNATQLEELDNEKLSDEKIKELKLEDEKKNHFNSKKNYKKENLKYIRDLKKKLLTWGFTDKELTNELQPKKYFQLKSEENWYCLFKNKDQRGPRHHEISQIITELAKNKAWEKFFAEKGITDPAHQEKWKQIGLSPISNQPEILPQTEQAWEKGWWDLTNPNIINNDYVKGGIHYSYQEITEEGETKQVIPIKLFEVSYSEAETYISLINKINAAKNAQDIKVIKEEREKIEYHFLRNRLGEKINNKTEKIWKRFFQLHPEIDTNDQKANWKNSWLNPVESSPEKADSQADQVWNNGWVNLIVNVNNNYAEIGEIEVMDDGKVTYDSYGYFDEFDSWDKLIERKKDGLDEENFWLSFKKYYKEKSDEELVDNQENWDKAEKWRQKGYFPSEAAEYQKNGWEPNEAAEHDSFYSGQASYEGRWYEMEHSKLDIENSLGIENNEAQPKSNTTELGEQARETETGRPVLELEGERREDEGGDAVPRHTANLPETEVTTNIELPTTITGTEIAEESSERATPYTISISVTSGEDEPRPKRSDEERIINSLKERLEKLKTNLFAPNSPEWQEKRNSLRNSLSEVGDNWQGYWTVDDNGTEYTIEEYIGRRIENEDNKQRAWEFFEQIKNETLRELQEFRESEDNLTTEEEERTDTHRESGTIATESEDEELYDVLTEDEPRTTERTKIPVTPPTKTPKDKPGNGGKIAVAILILVVAGAIGAGVRKWLSNRRKPKISKYN